jgi:hypothetical protein
MNARLCRTIRQRDQTLRERDAGVWEDRARDIDDNSGYSATGLPRLSHCGRDRDHGGDIHYRTAPWLNKSFQAL